MFHISSIKHISRLAQPIAVFPEAITKKVQSVADYSRSEATVCECIYSSRKKGTHQQSHTKFTCMLTTLLIIDLAKLENLTREGRNKWRFE